MTLESWTRLPIFLLSPDHPGKNQIVRRKLIIKVLKIPLILLIKHSLNFLLKIFRYLSTLYSHPSFPEDKQIAHKIIPELKTAVEKYWQKHLSPPWSSKYLKKIIAKSVRGQPVSFTDFFGYLVGQQLLKKVRSSIEISVYLKFSIFF